MSYNATVPTRAKAIREKPTKFRIYVHTRHDELCLEVSHFVLELGRINLRRDPHQHGSLVCDRSASDDPLRKVEITERRGLPAGHPMHRTRRDLEVFTRAFDRRLTSVLNGYHNSTVALPRKETSMKENSWKAFCTEPGLAEA